METQGSERLDEIRRILRAGPICPSCLGRAFGKLGRGLTNEERAEGVLAASFLLGEGRRDGPCWVCGGAFAEVASWAERAARLVEGVAFDSYLFGVRLSARLEEMECYFAERFSTKAIEPLKHAFNGAVGRRFERLFEGTTVAFTDPHVSFLIDLQSDRIRLQIASIYVLGRYRKLVRGIPQTRWPCRRCRGRGCEACQGTGKQYPESVEEWVSGPLVAAAGAKEERFHGAGREDIDALMLGEGRPFVLEIVEPRRRDLDLVALRDRVNARASGRVEISGLSYVGRRAVEAVKETKAAKRYRARVEFGEDVTPEDLDASLRFLVGTIAQRTPRRVAHRRSDRVRLRRLFAASGRMTGPRTAEVEFETEGGLYVKELVSGDDGRSEPSLAGRIGSTARVTELDVLEVAWPKGPSTPVDIPGEFS